MKKGLSQVNCYSCCEFPVWLDPGSPIRPPAYGLALCPGYRLWTKLGDVALVRVSLCPLRGHMPKGGISGSVSR